MSTHVVGDVRQSQLLWTYGPGALIDLPNLSVITMGIDRWDTDCCPPVEEARLLAAVRRVLGQQVERLRIPPFRLDEGADPLSAEGKIGVPVRPFPRWLRCVKCGLLAEYDSGLFKLKTNIYRPDLTHFVHLSGDNHQNKEADAVPARFLVACRNGHLDDFPWRWYVHGGPSSCKGTLRFFEQGASLQTENLWVKCDGKDCGAARSLVHAFGKEAEENLPACRGRHPHLERYDPDCSEPLNAVLLGATNGWFPVTLSALAIPVEKSPLAQLVSDGWEYFQDAESLEEIKVVLKTLVKSASLPGIGAYTPEQVWQAIQDKQAGNGHGSAVPEGDIKVPEWEVLISPNPPVDWPHFLSTRTSTPAMYQNEIEEVLLLERLREVNALIGYTRVEAPEETSDPEDRPEMADLSRGKPTWVPATEVHGEGIFIRLKESVVKQWEGRPTVIARDQKLEAGHRGWRNARKLRPGEGYPGIRYALLHTFAHLLIREFALECGYNAVSIRERIYSNYGEESPMAGILLYTAAADSDGTLGGLVELGKPENLRRLIEQALSRAAVCSSDPLCSEHDPSTDRSLHAASCHACAFVAETSCEKGNRYLDRSLLVQTLECKNAAFFDHRDVSNE